MSADTRNTEIGHTTALDADVVSWLFEQAMNQQGRNGYRVWEKLDKVALLDDIEQKRQYKIVSGDDILCVFSIQYSDPLIWGERDRQDAIYIHRIVMHPAFKGERRFQQVLDAAKALGRRRHMQWLRMDTWAANEPLIRYYQSFGFENVGNRKTPDAVELPLQNRNLDVALLQLKLEDDPNA